MFIEVVTLLRFEILTGKMLRHFFIRSISDWPGRTWLEGWNGGRMGTASRKKC